MQIKARHRTIGRLAQEAGINLETVRYYERRGLLQKPPRTASGYRMFPPEAERRLRFIKRAQDLGFSLQEIRELGGFRVLDPAIAWRTKPRLESLKRPHRAGHAFEVDLLDCKGRDKNRHC